MSDEPEKKIRTYDHERGVGIASGRPPLEAPMGPLRAAHPFYSGDHDLQRKDVERYPNGAIPGVRNKTMRRAQRLALKKRESKVERGLRNARALKAQALEVAKDEGRSSKYADRLLAKELAIHTPVYAPSKDELRAQRTERRRRARRGEVVQDQVDIVQDAIGQLVDAQAKKRGDQ